MKPLTEQKQMLDEWSKGRGDDWAVTCMKDNDYPALVAWAERAKAWIESNMSHDECYCADFETCHFCKEQAALINELKA